MTRHWPPYAQSNRLTVMFDQGRTGGVASLRQNLTETDSKKGKTEGQAQFAQGIRL